jgi:hypothetical protein
MSMKLSTKDLSLIIVFAALHAVFSIFPIGFTLGVQGQITFGVIIAPMIGILLGPYKGGLAVLLGSCIGMSLNPGGAIFGPLSFIPPFLGSFGTGCVKIKKGYWAGAAILASTIVFYANPSGRESFFYPWLHIVALIISISPLAKIARFNLNSNTTKSNLTFSIIISAFIGILTDHISGSAIAIWYFPFLTSEIWNTIMFIYPFERIIYIILTSLMVTPLFYVLKKTGFIK